MRTRPALLLASGALLLYALRHPIELRLLRHATATPPNTSGDPIQVKEEKELVDVDGIDDPTFHWSTSTTREDEGPASCETVFLTRLTIGKRVYE